MYLGFSWSIAVLIFVIETARKGLFKLIHPLNAALRLGIYACVALALVCIAMPDLKIRLEFELMMLFVIGFLYGSIMGYGYQWAVNRINHKPESEGVSG